MTPQEELFAKFFSSEAVLVKDMDDLTLKAHREELAAIAFEARARLSAVDGEDRTRTSKNSKRRGFETNDNEDISSETINTIKTRTQRMTKLDKVRKNLEEMGIPEEDIQVILSNRGLKSKVEQVNLPISKPEMTSAPGTAFNPFPNKEPKKADKQGGINWDEVIDEAKKMEAPKAVVNPFAKKE